MKKIIFVISLIVLSGFLFGLNTPDTKAQTVAELQAQIQQLMAQIAQLQAKLSQLQPEPITWCHNFNVNLGVGSRGPEVTALQTALQKEGLYQRTISGNFDEYTASIVVTFQEKYASETLAPWGLVRGTGYVGPTTRAKLNKLYGCGIIPPMTCDQKCKSQGYISGRCSTPGPIPAEPCTSDEIAIDTKGTDCGHYIGVGICCCKKQTTAPYIKVLSPNGGEKWIFGVPQTIKWTSSGITSGKTVGLYLMTTNNLMCHIASADALTGTYTITLKENQLCSNPYFTNLIAGRYKIFIDAAAATGIENLGDSSDNYFSILAESTPPAPILSPIGGEKWEQGTSQVIRWTPHEKPVSSVIISLYQKGVFQKTLSGVIPDSSGQWIWNIPANQPIGTSYSVRVSRLSYPNDFIADSNHFSVVVASTACTDSDGGKNYYQKGTVTYGSTVNTDTCSASGYLFEQYCINDKPAQATYWCTYGCKDGACYYQKITNISGQKNSYQTKEAINLVIKSITVDGIPASPADGWHVQYYTYNVNDHDNYLKEYVSSGNYNASYSNGYWHANYWAPSTEGNYFTEVVLYCSKEGSKCWNILGRNGLEWKEKINLTVIGSGEILVPGHDFYVKTSDTGTGNWSFAKDSCQAMGSGWTLPTMTQLRILYQKKNEIGGFKDEAYWSSDMGMYIHFTNGFESYMNPAMTFPSFRCVKKAEVLGVETMENQLASLVDVVYRVIEQFRVLLWR